MTFSFRYFENKSVFEGGAASLPPHPGTGVMLAESQGRGGATPTIGKRQKAQGLSVPYKRLQGKSRHEGLLTPDTLQAAGFPTSTEDVTHPDETEWMASSYQAERIPVRALPFRRRVSLYHN